MSNEELNDFPLTMIIKKAHQKGFKDGINAACQKIMEASKGSTKEESASMWRDMGLVMLYDAVKELSEEVGGGC